MAQDIRKNPWVFDAETQGQGYGSKDSYLLINTFTSTFAANTITITAHTLTTGAGPFRVTTSAADLPSGLAINTDYWVIRVDDDTLQLATSYANAKLGTAIALADDGTGTHKLVQKPVFAVRPFIGQLKVTTGATGGEVKITDVASGKVLAHWPSMLTSDFAYAPLNGYYEGVYIDTLKADMKVYVFHGRESRL